MEQFAEIGKKIKLSTKPGNVNIIHPFIETQTGDKLSIIGRYNIDKIRIVNGNGDSIPFNAETYYYGLNPEFGADKICEALNKGNFKNSDTLEIFMNDNVNLFTVPAEMSKYARALFAKTLIKMSTMFGYSFTCKDKDCYDKFCKIADDTAIKDIDYDTNEEEKNVRLLGHPQEKFINALDDIFSVDSDGKLTTKCDSFNRSIRDYISETEISLVRGKSYYSGVLPRVEKFEKYDTSYSNSSVTSIGIVFRRSTFATMDAFDSSYIKHHRLLQTDKYLKPIEEMDEIEDSLFDEYLSDLTDINRKVMDDPINNPMNEFLSKSYSVHNLAVSGNIITSDGYLVLAKRGSKTIDVNTYYCSINGQSEICDSNVDFYKQSVYEDMPTIHVDHDNRIDFMGELERETKAELGILCSMNHWDLRGISFLGIMNSDSKTAQRRRFHFNILAECVTEYSLSEIIDSQKKAIEKFENSNVIGIKIKRHKNIISRIINSIVSGAMMIIKSKDFVSSILAIAVFLYGFNDLKSSAFTLKGLSSIVSAIFTALSLIVIIVKFVPAIIKLIKNIPTHRKLSLIGQCNDFYAKVHKTLEHKKIILHPIADVMLYEYINNSL